MTWFEQVDSEEQMAAHRAAAEEARMRSEELTARIRRLIADELTYDQLETLHALLAHVSNSQHCAVIANWYEGIVHGAMAVRDLVLGQAQTPDPSRGR